MPWGSYRDETLYGLPTARSEEEVRAMEQLRLLEGLVPAPHLQIFGDGTVKAGIRTTDLPDRVFDTRSAHLPLHELRRLLGFIASTGVLDAPFRTCAEAAATSKDLESKGVQVAIVDAPRMTLEIRCEGSVCPDGLATPFHRTITCEHAAGYADLVPDVAWLDSVAAIERRLRELARRVRDREALAR
jgi:hypothetical protein